MLESICKISKLLYRHRLGEMSAEPTEGVKIKKGSLPRALIFKYHVPLNGSVAFPVLFIATLRNSADSILRRYIYWFCCRPFGIVLLFFYLS